MFNGLEVTNRLDVTGSISQIKTLRMLMVLHVGSWHPLSNMYIHQCSHHREPEYLQQTYGYKQYNPLT